jgi:hypothetical protein
MSGQVKFESIHLMAAVTIGLSPKTNYTAMHSNRWSPQQIAAQAQAIRLWCPWLAAKGPTSTEGLARVSQNALAHGAHNHQAKQLQKAVGALLVEMKLPKD